MTRPFMMFMVLAALVLTACSGGLPQSAKDLPPGDGTRGAALFTQSIDNAPACSGCHTVDGTASVGPSLKGFGAVAGTRESGMSAVDYAYESITKPAAFVVSGYGNLMYNQFAQHLSAQQTADLIAYVLSR